MRLLQSCYSKELLKRITRLRGYGLISRSSRKSWLELDTCFAMKLLYRYLIRARFLLFHKTNIKSPDLYPSFIGFNAIQLKFCNNMEITIPKKRMFSFFRFWHFSRENDVTKFPPNFVLYYGISNDGFWKKSPQGCQRWKNFWNIPIHSKDIAFWKFSFPPFCY